MQLNEAEFHHLGALRSIGQMLTNGRDENAASQSGGEGSNATRDWGVSLRSCLRLFVVRVQDVLDELVAQPRLSSGFVLEDIAASFRGTQWPAQVFAEGRPVARTFRFQPTQPVDAERDVLDFVSMNHAHQGRAAFVADSFEVRRELQ